MALLPHTGFVTLTPLSKGQQLLRHRISQQEHVFNEQCSLHFTAEGFGFVRMANGEDMWVKDWRVFFDHTLYATNVQCTQIPE